MKATYSSVALLSLFVATGTATVCNKSNAKPWPTSSSGSSGCNGDAACLALIAESQCNSQALVDSVDSTCVEARASTLQCTSSEVCYLYIDGDLLCLNPSTGNYHDDKGGNGNANTGVYTYADGEVLTNTGTAPGTRTSTATKTGAVSSAKSAKITSTTNGATQAATTTVNNAVQGGSSVTVAAAATSSRAGGAEAVAVAGDSLLSFAALAVAGAIWL